MYRSAAPCRLWRLSASDVRMLTHLSPDVRAEFMEYVQVGGGRGGPLLLCCWHALGTQCCSVTVVLWKSGACQCYIVLLAEARMSVCVMHECVCYA